MGTRFDSRYRRDAFDTGKRNHPFDTFGKPDELEATADCVCTASATASQLDPPAAPSNLTLAWGSLVITGYRKVVATWSDNSSNEDGFMGEIRDSVYWDGYSGWSNIAANTTTKSGNSGRDITNSQWARFCSFRTVSGVKVYSDWTYSDELPPY